MNIFKKKKIEKLKVAENLKENKEMPEPPKPEEELPKAEYNSEDIIKAVQEAYTFLNQDMTQTAAETYKALNKDHNQIISMLMSMHNDLLDMKRTLDNLLKEVEAEDGKK